MMHSSEAIAFPVSPVFSDDEPHFRSVVEALPTPLYITDGSGRITYYNDAASALWGRRPSLGATSWCGFWKLYRPDGTVLPHDQGSVALALRERRPIRGPGAVAERSDGTRISFVPSSTPLFDKDGDLTGAVNVLI
jgi:PAS domain-containing protein